LPKEEDVIEEAIEIETADGTADGFIYRADDGPPAPGVIHLTDIGGIRPAHCDMARRLAAKGFTVLMPNVFYRTGRPPVFDFTPSVGDDRTTKRFAELAGPLNPAATERDAEFYVDFLAAQASVSKAAMGVVGYCFTGSMAMRAAAVRPEKIAAAASFHGGGLFTDASTSPHLALPRIKAQLYFGHAIEDRSMPKEAIEKFERALAAWAGKYRSEVYEGAYHGWTTPGAPVYNERQADRAFEQLIDLLANALK
jgi:carboxymethylenebutenolidase